MRWLLFMLALPVFGQLPVVQLPQLKSAAASVTPQSLGNMMVYWINTNQVDKDFVTNWLDQIQSLPAKWDISKPTNTRPTNAIATGVFFDGFNFGQWLTNAALACPSNQTAVIRFKPTNVGFLPMGLWSDTASDDASITVDASVKLDWGGRALAGTIGANAELDAEMTISNGVLYAWTNGIAVITASAESSLINRKHIPTAIGALPGGGNYYIGYVRVVGLYTNSPFTTALAASFHQIMTNWFGGTP